jgi:hypothetical protein
MAASAGSNAIERWPVIAQCGIAGQLEPEQAEYPSFATRQPRRFPAGRKSRQQ